LSWPALTVERRGRRRKDFAMTPGLFIFDVEGTLIDCVQQSLICWRDALASHGYEFSIEELHPHSGRDPDDMLRILLPQAEVHRLAKPLKDMQGACYREADTAALLKAGLWSRIDAERARAAP
jgi:beta-phosphoglucomutase-like phosphatase (HAD superfamily)